MSRSKRRLPEPNAPRRLFGSLREALLFVFAMLALSGVALYFDLGVNRVFDVPKAVALKTIGGGTALVWLGLALFGPGVRWRSTRVFAAPVAALAVAVAVSTLFSLDPATSLYGVYERQFGLQGFLACVGLYFVVSSTLADRRGAVLGLAVVALLGAMIGAYAFLQSQGHDPWPFFRKPHDKVYAFLGNATFAGNALALIFPISAVVAAVGAAETRARAEDLGGWLAGLATGFGGLFVLLVVPGYLVAADLGPRASGQSAQAALRFGYALAGLGLFAALGMGSYGVGWLRLESEKGRRFADAAAAGALAAAALLIAMGIFFTRTRGAWVGTGVALFACLLLLPRLFRDQPGLHKRVRVGAWGTLGGASALFFAFVLLSDSLPARTIRSIPAAFDPSRTDFGKGQGTRPYLWKESIRVLTEHAGTLERVHDDRVDRARGVRGPLVESTPFRELEAPEGEASAALAQKAGVWLFGIGIETYRYAFMSHKSKRLEELDPMTNHDNPHNNYLYVLASFGLVGLAAYLWLLWSLLSRALRRFLDVERPRWERALAFGVVTSFFSYAVYSIAGFDSVACSVFFYVVLGLAAVLFEPARDEARAPLARWLVGSGEGTAGKQVGLSAALALGAGGLLLWGAFSGYNILRAERAFTGQATPGRPTVDKRVADIEAAIRIHPYESYYKQTLGTTHAQAATGALQQSRQLQQNARRAGSTEEAQQLVRRAQASARRARRHTELASIALHAALDHAWAPENIFISLFQALYAIGEDAEAEAALERALEHSPHLGAVRANLAALKAARGNWEGALSDCRWVLDVDRKSHMARRTCGKALLELGELDEAAEMLTWARRLQPKDPLTRKFIEALREARRARSAPPSTSAAAPSTSAAAPSTSVAAPSTSVAAPSTSVAAPSTSAVAPSTSVAATSTR